MKTLIQAAWEFSDMRKGAALLVIQILPGANPIDLDCQEASVSGKLAKSYSKKTILTALVATLEATLEYYRELLREAQ